MYVFFSSSFKNPGQLSLTGVFLRSSSVDISSSSWSGSRNQKRKKKRRERQKSMQSRARASDRKLCFEARTLTSKKKTFILLTPPLPPSCFSGSLIVFCVTVSKFFIVSLNQLHHSHSNTTSDRKTYLTLSIPCGPFSTFVPSCSRHLSPCLWSSAVPATGATEATSLPPSL